MSLHLRDLVLAPRAVAALVALRKGPRTLRGAELANALDGCRGVKTGVAP